MGDADSSDASATPDADAGADAIADGGADDWQLDEGDDSDADADAVAKGRGRGATHYPLAGPPTPRAPSGAAPTTVPPGQQNPLIQSVGALRIQRDGTHRWRVTFTLPAATAQGGFVIQHVQHLIDVGDGQGLLTNDDYWESWMIAPGATQPAFDPGANANDEYFANLGPPWHGAFQVIGTARFYELPSLPVPPFNGDGTTAQAIARTRPDFWSDEGSVHDLTILYDSRANGPAPRVTSTPNDAPILRVRSA